jgi:hypothetical protein
MCVCVYLFVCVVCVRVLNCSYECATQLYSFCCIDDGRGFAETVVGNVGQRSQEGHARNGGRIDSSTAPCTLTHVCAHIHAYTHAHTLTHTHASWTTRAWRRRVKWWSPSTRQSWLRYVHVRERLGMRRRADFDLMGGISVVDGVLARA